MIQVEGITKYYGERAAIRSLSFRVETGEVVGFLGLNGAGKTTTLKVLGCVLLPTSGRVLIDGRDSAHDALALRGNIGFLPDTPPLYDEMTVGAYLAFAGRLRGGGDIAGRVREVEKSCALEEVDGEVIGSLSHGYRQRVGLAQALIHRPKLIILDEPTSGLDPRQTVEMRAMIRALKGEHTVLVSSHILSEISQLCDRLLVIHDGEIIAQGSEEELAKSLGGGAAVEAEVQSPGARALEVLRTVDGVRAAAIAAEGGGWASLRIESPAELRPAIVKALVDADIALRRIDASRERLESIFLKVTRGKEAA